MYVFRCSLVMRLTYRLKSRQDRQGQRRDLNGAADEIRDEEHGHAKLYISGPH